MRWGCFLLYCLCGCRAFVADGLLVRKKMWERNFFFNGLYCRLFLGGVWIVELVCYCNWSLIYVRIWASCLHGFELTIRMASPLSRRRRFEILTTFLSAPIKILPTFNLIHFCSGLRQTRTVLRQMYLSSRGVKRRRISSPIPTKRRFFLPLVVWMTDRYASEWQLRLIPNT